MPRIHTTRFTIPAEAIDFNRHANNIEYLRWMQDAAVAHSTALGWPMERYLAERCTWVIRSHYIEYLRPGKLADPIHLATWVADLEEHSSRRKYLFWRESDQMVIARAETHWFFVDIRTGLPRPITETVRSSFPVVADENEVLSHLRETTSAPTPAES